MWASRRQTSPSLSFRPTTDVVASVEASNTNTWRFPSSDSISGDGRRKSANPIKRELLSHDGWVDADEELFFLVDCETLFIANAQDIPFKNLVRYVCVSGSICLVTDTQWAPALSWCILDHVANSDRDENQLTTRPHFDGGMIHVTFRHVLLLLFLQSSGDKSSWIGGAYMFRLMRRREQNDPQYPSHNPTHCMTFAVWESIWKCKPLSLFNKHVHLMYFDPLGSKLPAGEFDLSVACNFFSCEISILYWHLVGLSASSWWHSFLCVLFHLFAFFDILSFAGQTLINSGDRPTHGRRARQFEILLTRTFLSTRSFYLMTPWNFLFIYFLFLFKLLFLFFFCSLAVNIRMFLYFSFPFCSILLLSFSLSRFLSFFLSFFLSSLFFLFWFARPCCSPITFPSGRRYIR